MVTESVEGRRPVEGRAKANACSGHSAGTGMSPTARAHGPDLDGPPKPRTRLTFDRSPVQESCTPGSARGAGGNSCSYRDNFLRPASYRGKPFTFSALRD